MTTYAPPQKQKGTTKQHPEEVGLHLLLKYVGRPLLFVCVTVVETVQKIF